jgi:hypothetical protein
MRFESSLELSWEVARDYSLPPTDRKCHTIKYRFLESPEKAGD